MRIPALGFSLIVLLSAGAAAATVIPTPIGVGPRFQPGSSTPSTVHGLRVGSFTCARSRVSRNGVHLELFANDRVVVVPAGIGIAAPLQLRRGDVVSGGCSYPARTREPTGVIEIVRSTRLTLGDFFEIWGQPLGPHRLVGFRSDSAHAVRAYVDGRRVVGALEAVPLRRHAEIVLELGRYVRPHTTYRFRSGL